MARVSLEGVTKTFAGGVAAVRRLDLAIEDEQLVVLLGPSGCGKSTTLRMIAGLEEASAGEIRIGERVVNHVAPKDRDIAMVFQNYALYPHMTVYKNMAFGLELRYGGNPLARLWRRAVDPQRAKEMAEKRRGIRGEVERAARILGIEPLLQRMPRQLSGGERQRVALGRAIVRHPAVFLFDEPLSNLDAKLRVEMRREIKDLHRRLRATMVYVTHDQMEALTLGDRIAVMDRGELQQVGSPMEVYDRPKNRFVAGFLGSPPMSFVAGRLTSADGRAAFEGGGLRVALPTDRLPAPAGENREVVLGIRPEHVSVLPENMGDAGGAGVARVVLAEQLGDAALLHLELAPGASEENEPPRGLAADRGKAKDTKGDLVSRGEPRVGYRDGELVQVRIDAAQAHLFHPATGENLTLGEQGG